jgi:hypothetical protein
MVIMTGGFDLLLHVGMFSDPRMTALILGLIIRDVRYGG